MAVTIYLSQAPAHPYFIRYKMNIQVIAVNCRYSHSCLALFYVRNELQKIPGLRPVIRQFSLNDPYYATLLRISGSKPEAIFFSVYIWNSAYIGRLAVDLNLLFPDTPIVMGGPQAKALRASLPFSPTVIHGAIEGLGADFYPDLKEGSLKEDYFAATGAAFAYPYKQDDFSRQLKNRNIYYESSRGCPFSCAYCLSSVNRELINKEIPTVEKELADILQHKPKFIRFVDRTFNADSQRALAIWRFLAASPGETTFHFEIAPDLFNEEMFEFLAKLPAGLFQFEIGVQSTNTETLQAVNRRMNLDLASHNIRRLLSFKNIHLHVDLILGLPHETWQTFSQSIKDVFALGPHYIQMGLLKILPDTAIYRDRDNLGLIGAAQPPYEVMATAWLDHESLSRLFWLGECLEAFYNNPFFKTFFAYLNQGTMDIFNFFEELLDLCQQNNFFQLARTQKLMTEILAALTAFWPDCHLIKELLIYDWLRCGHHSLPECLPANLKESKDHLWHSMPDDMPPLFNRRGRHDFFKRTVFHKFSGELLQAAGLTKDEKRDGYVAFLAEETGLPAARKTVLLPIGN